MGSLGDLARSDHIRGQPLPKLSTVIVGEWAGTEEQAKAVVEQEAEALLLSALGDLEANLERVSSAAGAAAHLLTLYRDQARKKEYKAMEKRFTLLNQWVSDSHESSFEDETSDFEGESSDSDADDDDDSSPNEELGESLCSVRLVLSMVPGLAETMTASSDAHFAVADLEQVLEVLGGVHADKRLAVAPLWTPLERDTLWDTDGTELKECRILEGKFGGLLTSARRRDRAANLLTGGWDTLVEEGSPPRQRTEEDMKQRREFFRTAGSNEPEPELELELEPEPELSIEEKARLAAEANEKAVAWLTTAGITEGTPPQSRDKRLLEVELSKLKLGALSRRAVEVGASAAELEAVHDADGRSPRCADPMDRPERCKRGRQRGRSIPGGGHRGWSCGTWDTKDKSTNHRLL